MTVFNLIDSYHEPALNFKYRTQIIKFGYKKLFPAYLQKPIDSKSAWSALGKMNPFNILKGTQEDDENKYRYDKECFYLMMNVQIRSEFSFHRQDYFDEHESHRLISDLMSVMLDMIPFNFEMNLLRNSSPFEFIQKVFLDS